MNLKSLVSNTYFKGVLVQRIVVIYEYSGFRERREFSFVCINNKANSIALGKKKIFNED